MPTETQDCGLLLIDPDACRVGSLNEHAVQTLIGVASEDPSCWDDVAICWPRYRSPAVPALISELPLEIMDFHSARGRIESHPAWVVIDLRQRRVLTSTGFGVIERDEHYAMVVDDEGNQHWPLSVHLPPWWELISPAETHAIDAPRSSPLVIPSTDRAFLYGRPLVDDLATRILDIVADPPTPAEGVRDDEKGRYALTVQVHRDWLMTPRAELDGRTPRQLLHGGREWIDSVTHAQQLRLLDGCELVALPTQFTGYADAPFGTEELVVYFELCRELIEAGWQWCDREGTAPPTPSARAQRQQRLADYLEETKETWLTAPGEEGAPPQLMIECSRRRVPRTTSVPTVGIDQPEQQDHAFDCDCPLCLMMAEDELGIGFVATDGHHLELDGEFAFSLHETREAWEAEQREFAEMSANFDLEWDQGESESDGTDDEPDPFAPVWKGLKCDEPIPGDSEGHLGLAFLLAELIGTLKSAGAAPTAVDELNRRFTDYRHETWDRLTSAEALGDWLEHLAQQYPQVTSQAADFQSRLADAFRKDRFRDDEAL